MNDNQTTGQFKPAEQQDNQNPQAGQTQNPNEPIFKTYGENEAKESPWLDPTKPTTKDPANAALHWKKRFEDSQEYIKKLNAKIDSLVDKMNTIEQLQRDKQTRETEPRGVFRQAGRQDKYGFKSVESPGSRAGKSDYDDEDEDDYSADFKLLPDEDEQPAWFDPEDAFDPTTKSGRWYRDWMSRNMRRVQDAVIRRAAEEAEKRFLEKFEQVRTKAEIEKEAADMKAFFEGNKIPQEEQEGYMNFLKNPPQNIPFSLKFRIYKMISEELNKPPKREPENEISIKRPSAVVFPAAGGADILPNDPNDEVIGMLKTYGSPKRLF